MGVRQRVAEQNVEDIRRDARKNIKQISHVHDYRKIGRLVDAKEVMKCRVKEFGAWEHGAKRLRKSQGGEDYEKHRNHYNSGYHSAEWELGVCLEKLYWEKYGEGFDGTPVPPRIGEEFTCPKCGHHWAMPITALPLKCHCNRETPKGMLVADKYYKA